VLSNKKEMRKNWHETRTKKVNRSIRDDKI